MEFHSLDIAAAADVVVAAAGVVVAAAAVGDNFAVVEREATVVLGNAAGIAVDQCRPSTVGQCK